MLNNNMDENNTNMIHMEENIINDPYFAENNMNIFAEHEELFNANTNTNNGGMKDETTEHSTHPAHEDISKKVPYSHPSVTSTGPSSSSSAYVYPKLAKNSLLVAPPQHQMSTQGFNDSNLRYMKPRANSYQPMEPPYLISGNSNSSNSSNNNGRLNLPVVNEQTNATYEDDLYDNYSMEDEYAHNNGRSSLYLPNPQREHVLSVPL